MRRKFNTNKFDFANVNEQLIQALEGLEKACFLDNQKFLIVVADLIAQIATKDIKNTSRDHKALSKSCFEARLLIEEKILDTRENINIKFNRFKGGGF